MARFTIDRFEGREWAVLEDDQARTFRIPGKWLPAEAREGDVVNATDDVAREGATTIRFELDPATRDERLAKARRLREQLPRAPKGDISL